MLLVLPLVVLILEVQVSDCIQRKSELLNFTRLAVIYISWVHMRIHTGEKPQKRSFAFEKNTIASLNLLIQTLRFYIQINFRYKISNQFSLLFFQSPNTMTTTIKCSPPTRNQLNQLNQPLYTILVFCCVKQSS